MFVLAHGTWILVADGAKALFLRNDGNVRTPDLNVVRVETQDNPPDREQSVSPPGRRPDGASGQMSAMEQTDWHEMSKDRFAEETAAILNRYAHDGRFERLVIVAPPSTLGALRTKLNNDVADKIVAEIDKDFTNHPVDAIQKLLVDAL
ncbi:host attachment family protein [Celeribacter arenosi]|uniref:Host attachment family protein n=1 Tax=Celeribacter arenosi TaxID=792649 RepID=A0ABP7KGW2_9RHOB